MSASKRGRTKSWMGGPSVSKEVFERVFHKMDTEDVAALSGVCCAFRDAARDVFEERRRDVSRGSERFPIPCENSVDAERFPFKFTYISKSVLPENSLELDEDGSGIQSSLSVPVELRKSDKKGWGVHACGEIAEGSLVCEYVGEIISSKEAVRRLKEYDSATSGEGHCLLVVREILPSRRMQLRSNIDATKMGNVARFINHRCDGGNLELLIGRGRGQFLPRIMLHAKFDIRSGEELSFSYGESLSAPLSPGGKNKRPCFCGAGCCGGYLPAEEI
ncbi:hypothetical protein BSKO_12472 [Bryopsis sp. KO-2023]|nr:hypothetical protein BSKO_12472 [Bryopsis sp. KO-2023]